MIELEGELALDQSTFLTETFALPLMEDYFPFIPLVGCLVCSITVSSTAVRTYS